MGWVLMRSGARLASRDRPPSCGRPERTAGEPVSPNPRVGSSQPEGPDDGLADAVAHGVLGVSAQGDRACRTGSAQLRRPALLGMGEVRLDPGRAVVVGDVHGDGANRTGV